MAKSRKNVVSKHVGVILQGFEFKVLATVFFIPFGHEL